MDCMTEVNKSEEHDRACRCRDCWDRLRLEINRLLEAAQGEFAGLKDVNRELSEELTRVKADYHYQQKNHETTCPYFIEASRLRSKLDKIKEAIS